MGLWSWLGRRKPASGRVGVRVAPAQPQEPEPLTAEQREDLQVAWAELAEAAKESTATGFHACSRGGRPWQEDPAAVRTVAALIRSVDKDDAGPERAPAS